MQFVQSKEIREPKYGALAASRRLDISYVAGELSPPPKHHGDQKAQYDVVKVHGVVPTMPKLPRYGDIKCDRTRDRTPLPTAVVCRGY
jgi:hypothetical protein